MLCYTAKIIQDPPQWWNFIRPPYSSNVTPCDYTLFPKMKGFLQGQRFLPWEGTEHTVQQSVRQFNRTHPADGLHHLLQICNMWGTGGGGYNEGQSPNSCINIILYHCVVPTYLMTLVCGYKLQCKHILTAMSTTAGNSQVFLWYTNFLENYSRKIKRNWCQTKK
jgi:hypothetical protein